MHAWLVRNALYPLHERLTGRRTMRVLRRLRRSQWWPADALRSLQLDKLRHLVGVALNETAAYADLAGLPRHWRPASLADLQQLPLLDKQMISAHRERLINRDVSGGPVWYRTGGSSGQPLIFTFDKRRQAYDKAARIRAHEWWSVRLGEREAHVWNAPIELDRTGRVKRWRDTWLNERIFPASTLGPETIAAFVGKLKAFRPVCVFGYPSAIEMLCDLSRRAGLRLDDMAVRVVFATGEILYDHQRALIAETFGGAAVANNYGSREAGFIAHECPAGRMHLTDENVIVEIVRNGQPVEPGEDGEIVVTQLDCLAMPFIRYRTGDLGQLASQPCACGRGLGVMDVVRGRSNDFLVAPDGHIVHGSAVHAALSGTPGIVRFQLRQGSDHNVTILLTVDERFAPGSEAPIADQLAARLAGAHVSVTFCDDIPPGPAGKHRYIISELSTLTHKVSPVEQGR